MLAAAALVLVAAAVQVTGEAAFEMSAGEAPLAIGAEPRAGMVSTLTPKLGLSWRGESDQEVRLSYGPRLLWRQPNEAALGRPLYLHVVHAGAALRPSRRTMLSAEASLTEGELDYASLRQVLGKRQSALTSESTVLEVNGVLRTQHELSRRWQGGLALTVSRLGPSPRADEAPPPPAEPQELHLGLARQLTLGAAPSATWRLSRQDALALEGAVAYDRYDAERKLRYLVSSLQLGWTHQGAPHHSLRVHGGISYSHSLGETADLTGSDQLSPLLGLAVETPLYRSGRATLVGAFGTGASLYLDPVLAAPVPQGQLEGRLTLALPPRWSVELSAGMFTSLRRRPLPETPDETLVTLTLPVRYLRSKQLSFELGGRFLDRGPHLRAPDFAFHQREIWVYFAVLGTLSTPGARPQAPPPVPVRAP